MSHSPAVNILGTVFEYSEALRVFRGEKRERGGDKDRSGKKGREREERK